jgi:hypothetical protein
LVDGKQVELGPWRQCADQFIGPSVETATEAFTGFQPLSGGSWRCISAS